jgi:hypothetical protein
MITYTKIILDCYPTKWAIDLDVRTNSVTLLDERVREHTHDFGLDRYFRYDTQRTIH